MLILNMGCFDSAVCLGAGSLCCVLIMLISRVAPPMRRTVKVTSRRQRCVSDF